MNCPECGALLRERTGKRGRFIGCSAWPKCSYTRSAKPGWILLTTGERGNVQFWGTFSAEDEVVALARVKRDEGFSTMIVPFDWSQCMTHDRPTPEWYTALSGDNLPPEPPGRVAA